METGELCNHIAAANLHCAILFLQANPFLFSQKSFQLSAIKDAFKNLSMMLKLASYATGEKKIYPAKVFPSFRRLNHWKSSIIGGKEFGKKFSLPSLLAIECFWQQKYFAIRKTNKSQLFEKEGNIYKQQIEKFYFLFPRWKENPKKTVTEVTLKQEKIETENKITFFLLFLEKAKNYFRLLRKQRKIYHFGKITVTLGKTESRENEIEK